MSPLLLKRLLAVSLDRNQIQGRETYLLTSKTKPPSVSTLKEFPLVVTPNFAKAGRPRTQAVTATDAKDRRMMGSRRGAWRRALFGVNKFSIACFVVQSPLHLSRCKLLPG
jgi:hypothetical protein